MKYYLYILLSGFLVFSCSDKKNDRENLSTEEIKKQAKETVDKTSEFIKKEAEDFRNNYNNKLDDVDKEIEDLKKSVSDKDGNINRDLQKRIDELEVKRKSLKEQLEETGVEAQKDWKVFKKDANEALEDLEKEIEELKRKY